MRTSSIANCVWVVAIGLSLSHAAFAHDEPADAPIDSYKVTDSTLLELWGPKEDFGAWYVPPMPPLKDRMQAVHMALLPNGKVLIVNGSGFRLKYCNGCREFMEGADGNNYDVVNNTGIYDPSADVADDEELRPLGKNVFTRIASPKTGRTELRPLMPDAPAYREAGENDSLWSNDLFCAGHLHLPNGNVLFAGGNRMNYPGMKFTGSNYANTYDWQNNRWLPPQALQDGHWYPSLVELADGRIVVLSGLKGQQGGQNNFNSSIVEIYDDRASREQAWTHVDILKVANSPFNSPIAAGATELDKLDHYPRLFPLSDGRLFISGDGSGGGNPKCRNTYFMTVGPSAAPGQPPTIEFALGPPRTSNRRIYDSGLIDPNSTTNDVLLIGGMLGNERTTIGPAFPPRRRDAVTAAMERYRPPDATHPLGKWEPSLVAFLGDRPEDARVMHVATLLPTKEILVVGGGNFPFQRPVFEPILFSPGTNGTDQVVIYNGKRMNPGTQPRLYHSNCLLLPDGRVLVAGGNAVRAAIEVNEDQTLARDPKAPDKFPIVHLNTFRNPRNDQFFFTDPGKYNISAEIHQIEIFYPPYLFGRGKRPKIVGAPDQLTYGGKSSFKVENFKDSSANAGTRPYSAVLIKLGSATHAFDYGQCLVNLTTDVDEMNSQITVTAPTNAHLYPPGYYTLFYVNNSGKPSIAKIVRLSS